MIKISPELFVAADEVEEIKLLGEACDCEYWEVNITKLDESTFYAHVHGMDYDGKKFDYCPWCGRKLK